MEYEARLKRYVDHEKGFITEEQLMFSFADLKTFNKLGQEDTVLHKLLYSSWVTGLNMLETPAAAGAKNKHLTYQTPKG